VNDFDGGFLVFGVAEVMSAEAEGGDLGAGFAEAAERDGSGGLHS
jgi:hypothetical protein